ncbi:hypothetical protein GHT06_008704 [Daphnia sinensis]|uniref:Uncharacterized protein n=1 Tax=Daphnia sinensis TaxID=1820382 RepID=A0AAD5LVS9_9CRUS|nr:hypothetical protein GHT06_008704 [Daphnia sinensis]
MAHLSILSFPLRPCSRATWTVRRVFGSPGHDIQCTRIAGQGATDAVASKSALDTATSSDTESALNR